MVPQVGNRAIHPGFRTGSERLSSLSVRHVPLKLHSAVAVKPMCQTNCVSTPEAPLLLSLLCPDKVLHKWLWLRESVTV